MRLGDCRSYSCFAAIFLSAAFRHDAVASDFDFDRETLSFANTTVFQYKEGKAHVRRNDSDTRNAKPYSRRCFVMSRTVLQFHKFARFAPGGAPLDDKELAGRVRKVTHEAPWHAARPREQRIVFPGYRDLRALSEARARVLQDNIGLGWPTYFRPGNGRMFYQHAASYQERTHANINRALARREFFIAYLSDFPTLHINHSVLIYARKPVRSESGVEHYLVYDPNHPDAPRELKWILAKGAFDFQKDEEFPGGFTRVFQVYGKPWQ
jgi:hypothetical protein